MEVVIECLKKTTGQNRPLVLSGSPYTMKLWPEICTMYIKRAGQNNLPDTFKALKLIRNP